MKPHTVTNCLSIDVESFTESNEQSFAIPPAFRDPKQQTYEVEQNLDAILGLLDEARILATFFFVGTIARARPQLVLRVSGLGHEVASHSYEHLRLFGGFHPEFAKRLSESKKELENLIGARVEGFRAPEFSITTRTLWALDVLRELGFTYDSSIYPTGLHDVYGIAGANPFIHILSNGLVEFPPATISVLGRRIPFGGGGYYRLYPLEVTRFLLRRQNQDGHSVMVWLHPYEIGPSLPEIPGLPLLRRFRHYYHARNGQARFRQLLGSSRFAPAIEILREKGMIGDHADERASP